MDPNLLNPTLKETPWQKTKSYNINKLVYPAFLGGLIPTIILSAKNAYWLKVDKKIRTLLLTAGILLFVAKFIMICIMFNQASISATDQRYIRLGSRLAAVLLYYINLKAMQSKYHQHIMLGGEDEPLVKDAIIFIVIGIIVEFVLLFIGKVVFANDF